MIAIPSAFVGAMENWGLLTYGYFFIFTCLTTIIFEYVIMWAKFRGVYHGSESVLLYDADVSSLDDRQTVVELVTHELAHQWFGNLVTMDW